MSMRGFTLIETMIAVTILSLSIAGPLFTASRAIVAAQISRDQLTASYLAQEGIEYVRILRDNEYLALYPPGTLTSTTAWNNFNASAISSCASPNICTLGPAQGNGTLPVAVCPGGTCSASFSLSTPGTPFKRTLQKVNVSSTDEKIMSSVSWSFHGVTYTVSVTDHLTPWQ